MFVLLQTCIMRLYLYNLYIDITEIDDAEIIECCIINSNLYYIEIINWRWQLFFLWRRGVVVITTEQLYSTKSELRLCAGSNSAREVSEIHGGEDLWQWPRLEVKWNTFRRSTISQKQSSYKKCLILVKVFCIHVFLFYSQFLVDA